jgi:hypothetical protein
MASRSASIPVAFLRLSLQSGMLPNHRAIQPVDVLPRAGVKTVLTLRTTPARLLRPMHTDFTLHLRSLVVEVERTGIDVWLVVHHEGSAEERKVWRDQIPLEFRKYVCTRRFCLLADHSLVNQSGSCVLFGRGRSTLPCRLVRLHPLLESPLYDLVHGSQHLTGL